MEPIETTSYCGGGASCWPFTRCFTRRSQTTVDSYTRTPRSSFTNTNDKKQLGSSGGVDIEEEEQSTEDSRDLEYHPLLNNVILNSIFKSVRREDLKSCRLVCKQWNVLTIPFIRSEFKANIFGDKPSRMKSMNIINKYRNTRRIQDFVTTLRSNTFGIPFSTFELGSFCTTNGVGQEFLQLCGNTTKEVILNDWEEVRFTVEDVSELLKSMPNIESLSILNYPLSSSNSSGNDVKLFLDSKARLIHLRKLRLELYNKCSSEVRKELCPTFIEELLSVTPNLSELILENSKEDEDIFVIPVLNGIEQFGMESSIRKLTLDYMNGVHVDSLHRMALKGLMLKKLTVHACDKNVSLALHPTLTFFKDTLETFKLNYASNIIEFPKMRRLTNLNLMLPVELYSNLKFVNLNKIFPELTQFKFNNPYYDVTYKGKVEFFPQSEPCPNVKSFHLAFYGFVFDLRMSNRIITIFPKLTELNLHSRVIMENGDEILMKIWTEMTQLEYLSISANIATRKGLDSIFTGIPTSVIQKMVLKVSTLTKMTRELRRKTIERLRNKYCRFPNITNLKNLRGLDISVSAMGEIQGGTGGRRSKWLTDMSAYLGLYSMEKLNQLKISSSEITPTCIEVLTKDLGLKYSLLKEFPFTQHQYQHWDWE